MDHSRNPSTSASEAAIDPLPREDPTYGSSGPADASSHLGFSKLRSVQWRTKQGILPSASSSIDDFRRAAADSRRRYAALRRRLLVDPHLCKDGNKSSDLSMHNPLSQNPDSPWVRSFQNAEVEKMVNLDLSRLYPGQGSYFQTPACQAMLRRILLLWSVKNPECGYKQGMHELLAPLLYVLHVDLQCLSELQTRYQEHFVDGTCGILETDIVLSRRLVSGEDHVNGGDEKHAFQEGMENNSGLGNVDPDMWNIILSSEPYGAEGELGAVLSERFLEHDGYCMFDSLMGGAHGLVAMADFFSPNNGPKLNSSTVIEDTAALYHLLSFVDSYLHKHLADLRVEPQYFALRWLRVLFVREFSLENVLLIWDEIFSASETGRSFNFEDNQDPSFKLLSSPCGMFISAMAVSMILHLRSSLLATVNATSCLQKLLNFPENICATELIENAKSLQDLDPNGSSPLSLPSDHPLNGGKCSTVRGGISSPLHTEAENYWEEKWRVLNQEYEQKKENRRNLLSGITRFYSGRFSLSGIKSVTSSSRNEIGGKDGQLLVRTRSFGDLTQEANSMDFNSSDAFGTGSPCKNSEQDCDLGNSLTSNLFTGDNAEDVTSSRTSRCSTPPVNRCGDSAGTAEVPAKSPSTPNVSGKQTPSSKEKKALPGKFPWPWKFGKSASGRSLGKGGSPSPQKLPFSGKGGSPSPQKSPFSMNTQKDHARLPTQEGSSSHAKSDVKDGQMTNNLRNLGQSIVKNVEIIEEFVEQSRVQARSFKNKSIDKTGTMKQLDAIVALKELRKISNLLSDM